MPTEELTIETFQQKDLRLSECLFQRLAEVPEKTQLNIQLTCTGETKFGVSAAREKLLLATVKLEVTMTLQSAKDIQTAIAKIVVGMQGIFIFNSDVEIIPTTKASPTTVQAASDRLLPATLQYLKRVCIDAGLPTFNLPVNMAELTSNNQVAVTKAPAA